MKDIPANSVAAGNSCKGLRKIDEKDKKYYYQDWKWERSGNNWKSVLSVPCKVGKNDISANRTQGNLTTPAGAFTII